MIFVGDVLATPPTEFKTPLQEKTYQALNELKIPFKRVDNDDAVTMEDCIQINEKLDVKTVKTLFLCNRQKTEFYLLITVADKPFKTKTFSSLLDVSRVSFAPPELLDQMLGTKVGATSVFGVLLDDHNKVRVIIDRDVLDEEWFGCSDGTTTCYMKIKMDHIINDFLPFTKHRPQYIRL